MRIFVDMWSEKKIKLEVAACYTIDTVEAMRTSGGEEVREVKRRRQAGKSNAGAEEEAGTEGEEGE